ncbi:MAG: DegT/DnrJ/EryC1/StrS family aminotransferase [Oligoflexia bacterium]|nr:DegT/DnrJ/EryC1/StrS family aminotransferase [Oligoflexia bacterium]
MRNVPFARPIIGAEEKQAVAKVLEGDTLVHGPVAKEFEKKFAQYTKAPHAISVSSCTAGLHLAYFYLGIKPGDEVIVPAQTHVATVHAVELCGGKPIFVDAEINTGNIDISQIEKAITPKTKALSVVHYLGMPVDMPKVMAIAKKHNLFVVEDCALAIGTKYDGIHAGLFGDVGTFSFYPVKHITTAEGGMMILKDDAMAKKLTFQKAFGVDRTPSERVVPGVYDVIMLGFNYRMNEIEAALGIEQLKRIDGFLKTRKRNYEALEKHLKEVDEVQLFQSSHGPFESSYYCLSVILKGNLSKKRTQVLTSLKELGVGSSVYYPQAVHQFSYYKNKYHYADNAFPVASLISDTSVALPVGPHLNEEDVNYVADSLKQVIQKLKRG